MEAPKLFISYSWSNPEHEQWVIDLATELRQSGLDVILDKWDLQEGNDAHVFMEKMVTDPVIKKVAIISDSKYVEKANNRSGGVGAETQIISGEIYEKQDQNKFVVIVAEKDENGKPYLPVYYKSRIYIDLSEPDRYTENFDKLLRWVYDKPLYIKPEIGKSPAFLHEEQPISLATTVSFRRAIEALKNSKMTASGALDEYFEILTQNFELCRINKASQGEFDDILIKNINDFLPYRNEFIELLIIISKYAPTDNNILKIHRFFENLIPYMYSPPNISIQYDHDYDNFKFIIHELFLYTIAILLKYELFGQTVILLNQQYYFSHFTNSGDVMKSFIIFNQDTPSLKRRNDRLALRRMSLRADLLQERNGNTGIDFKYLMQADFVLFFRAELEAFENKIVWVGLWWPVTLLYLGHYNSPFEIFARSISKQYFENVKCLFNIDSSDDLSGLLKSYENGTRKAPAFDWHTSINPSGLLGYSKLATKP